jgi:hypothetical protein
VAVVWSSLAVDLDRPTLWFGGRLARGLAWSFVALRASARDGRRGRAKDRLGLVVPSHEVKAVLELETEARCALELAPCTAVFPENARIVHCSNLGAYQRPSAMPPRTVNALRSRL